VLVNAAVLDVVAFVRGIGPGFGGCTDGVDAVNFRLGELSALLAEAADIAKLYQFDEPGAPPARPCRKFDFRLA
jgi:hypothetical protein